jgi:hypothetical protein
MSHITKISFLINNLVALRKAGEELGMTMKDQSTYKWFGQHVGDYPIPEGYTVEDMGKCEFALSIPHNSEAYEIGIVERKDGMGWDMLWDFWEGGYGLQETIGEDGNRLKQLYSKHAVIEKAQRNGFRVKEERDEKGQIQLRLKR